MNYRTQGFMVLIIGILTFFFLEAFFNMVLYINGYIILNIDHIQVILPWLIVYSAIIFLAWIPFGSKILKEQYKIYTLILVIAICRIFSQFYLDAAIFLLTNLLVFIISLVFFVELFQIYKKRKYLSDYQVILGGIILGIGINFAFYIITISSILSSDLTKLPSVIAFSIILVYLNHRLFRPESYEKFQIAPKEMINEPQLKRIGYFQFFLMGIFFFFTISWLLSPVTLSAYDNLNLSANNLSTTLSIKWVSYGFIYYIFVILVTAIVSFFLIRKLFSAQNKFTLKIILLSANLISCVINSIAILIIEQDLSLLSTVYITALTACGIFTILLNFSFIIHYYSFPGRRKAYIAYFLFIFALISSAIVEMIISWALYSSFLISITIFSLLYFSIFLLTNLRKISSLLKQKITITKGNKLYGTSFVLILVINISCFGFIIFTRTISPPPTGNPTFLVYNTHNCVGIDDKFDIDRVIDIIKSYDADIVGLNEIDMGHIKSGYMDLASYFAHKLNMYYYYGPTYYKHYGNVILSKYPILEAENFALPLIVKGWEPRAVIRAVININSENWTVYVTHLSTKHDDRLAQVDYNYSNSVVSIINRTPFTNVVWMGDLNFEPTSEEYSKLNASPYNKFRDTHAFLSSNPNLTSGFDEYGTPHQRIDYILCSPNLTPIESQVICSPASDHCAVLTRF
ncbi:MAG: endonuclease/exonuclease/phosphatase family protein [Candidatus Helarchaeota archaeon]|nr:endonuclease/exonuclease/phosphatase family protein [Candidatus Helarchaeota archaeon]